VLKPGTNEPYWVSTPVQYIDCTQNDPLNPYDCNLNTIVLGRLLANADENAGATFLKWEAFWTHDAIVKANDYATTIGGLSPPPIATYFPGELMTYPDAPNSTDSQRREVAGFHNETVLRHLEVGQMAALNQGLVASAYGQFLLWDMLSPTGSWNPRCTEWDHFLTTWSKPQCAYAHGFGNFFAASLDDDATIFVLDAGTVYEFNLETQTCINAACANANPWDATGGTYSTILDGIKIQSRIAGAFHDLEDTTAEDYDSISHSFDEVLDAVSHPDVATSRAPTTWTEFRGAWNDLHPHPDSAWLDAVLVSKENRLW
ncbi:MAG: hypothetical protein LC620_00120, partial [Halobacteriales archaeon]|nr:hypothetical protein [Halobacteriales archaeon]